MTSAFTWYLQLGIRLARENSMKLSVEFHSITCTGPFGKLAILYGSMTPNKFSFIDFTKIRRKSDLLFIPNQLINLMLKGGEVAEKYASRLLVRDWELYQINPLIVCVCNIPQVTQVNKCMCPCVCVCFCLSELSLAISINLSCVWVLTNVHVPPSADGLGI